MSDQAGLVLAREDVSTMKKSYTHIAKWFQHLPLLMAIAVWGAATLMTFTGLGWIWTHDLLGIWRVPETTNSLGLTKVALPMLGGIGTVGYLVIKYRERSSAEHAEVREQIQQAVTRPASEVPQERIAGVYALSGIADKYQGDYRQRVVNILCGYLRIARRADASVESTIIETLHNNLARPPHMTAVAGATAFLIFMKQYSLKSSI